MSADNKVSAGDPVFGPGDKLAANISEDSILETTPRKFSWMLIALGLLAVFISTGEIFIQWGKNRGWSNFSIARPGGSQAIAARTLAVENGGQVYVGTDEGLMIFHPVGHAAVYIYPDPNWLNLKVNALAADPRGGVWVGTPSGVQRLLPSGDLESQPGPKGELSATAVSALAVTENGRLWVGTTSGELYFCDPVVSRNDCTRYINRFGKQIDSGINALAETWPWLWIGKGTELYQLHEFSKNTLRRHPVDTLSLTAEENGQVWVGGIEEGLAVRSPVGNWTYYTQKNSGLNNNRVTALTMDRQGHLWVGTSEGLQRFDPGLAFSVQLVDAWPVVRLVGILISIMLGLAWFSRRWLRVQQTRVEKRFKGPQPEPLANSALMVPIVAHPAHEGLTEGLTPEDGQKRAADLKRERSDAVRVYNWLLVSPLLTIPCFLLQAYPLSARSSTGERVLAALVPLIFHVILLAYLTSSHLFVRRHVQQGLILVALRTLCGVIALNLGTYPESGIWLILVGSGCFWLFGSLWGRSQALRGDCWLMHRRGESGHLPRPWELIDADIQETEAQPEPSPAQPASLPQPEPATPATVGMAEPEKSPAPHREEVIAGLLDSFRTGTPAQKQESIERLTDLGEVEIF